MFSKMKIPILSLLFFSLFIGVSTANISDSKLKSNAKSSTNSNNIIAGINWKSKSAGNITHDLKYRNQPPFNLAMSSFFQEAMYKKIALIGLFGEPFKPSKIPGFQEFSEILKSLNINKQPLYDWTPKIYARMIDQNLLDNANFRKDRNHPMDLVSEFLSVDLDGDGDEDWLVFLYGFTQLKKTSKSYLNCGEFGCDDGDVTFPVMAMINDKGSFRDLTNADRFFTSGKAPHVKNARMLRLGDLNKDGQLDFIIAEGGWDNPPHGFNPSYKSHIFLSSPTGFKHQAFGKKAKAHGITIGDIDGDADLDFIISYIKDVAIYKNDGNGNFHVSSTLLPKHHTNFSELVDVDMDGDLDLLLGTSGCKSKSKFWLNDGEGKFSTTNKIILTLGKPNIKLCLRHSGLMEDWLNAEYKMIHHLIDFKNHILLIVSNNHVGWGYRTLKKTDEGLEAVNDGKFLFGVNLNHFPYRILRKNKTDITVYDFSFQPYKFKFNEKNGQLNLKSKH